MDKPTDDLTDRFVKALDRLDVPLRATPAFTHTRRRSWLPTAAVAAAAVLVALVLVPVVGQRAANPAPTPMPIANSSASPPPPVVTTPVTATRGCYQLAVRNDGARFVTVVPNVRVDEVAITDSHGGVLVEATSSPDGKNELRRPYMATAAPDLAPSPSATPVLRYTIQVGLAVWNDFAQVAGPSIYEVRVLNHSGGANKLQLDGQCAGK